MFILIELEGVTFYFNVDGKNLILKVAALDGLLRRMKAIAYCDLSVKRLF